MLMPASPSPPREYIPEKPPKFWMCTDSTVAGCELSSMMSLAPAKSLPMSIVRVHSLWLHWTTWKLRSLPLTLTDAVLAIWVGGRDVHEPTKAIVRTPAAATIRFRIESPPSNGESSWACSDDVILAKR